MIGQKMNQGKFHHNENNSTAHSACGLYILRNTEERTDSKELAEYNVIDECRTNCN